LQQRLPLSDGQKPLRRHPSRPVTMIVPFAAGGPADSLARPLAERMRAPFGRTIVIENVTGAGGSIGVGKVAQAAPDGYTIGIGNWSTHVVNGVVYPLSYGRSSRPLACGGRASSLLLTISCTSWLGLPRLPRLSCAVRQISGAGTKPGDDTRVLFTPILCSALTPVPWGRS
jgi:hypothetical protein